MRRRLPSTPRRRRGGPSPRPSPRPPPGSGPQSGGLMRGQRALLPAGRPHQRLSPGLFQVPRGHPPHEGGRDDVEIAVLGALCIHQRRCRHRHRVADQGRGEDEQLGWRYEQHQHTFWLRKRHGWPTLKKTNNIFSRSSGGHHSEPIFKIRIFRGS